MMKEVRAIAPAVGRVIAEAKPQQHAAARC
jgi:hypothetical protein